MTDWAAPAPVPVADGGGRPALSRATVDRAAHHRTDRSWLAAAWPTARVLVVDPDGGALVTGGGPPGSEDTGGGPALVLVDPDRAPAGERLFLGEDGGEAYFAVVGALPDVAGARRATLREVGADLGDRDAGLLVAAVALDQWHRAHLHSPRTGAATEVRSGGWVREAVDGSGSLFPRTDPAMIVLVHDGVAGPAGRCLLGRQPVWPPGRYSCLAGFVEPGESAEMSVEREVAEEAGVRVRSVQYVASQPWPFPGSLMLGFSALADADQPIVLVDDELEDARWFTRDDLRGKGAEPAPLLPPPASIAHHLITGWLGP